MTPHCTDMVDITCVDNLNLEIDKNACLALNVERSSRRTWGRNDNVTKPDVSVKVGIVRYRSPSPDNEHVFQTVELACTLNILM